MTKAHGAEEPTSSARPALAHDERIVLEEALTAREIECGRIGRLGRAG